MVRLQMLSSLSAQEGLIANCKERYAALENHVMQRLRWAAGANPSLNTTLQHFQDASTARAQILEVRVHPLSHVVLCDIGPPSVPCHVV